MYFVISEVMMLGISNDYRGIEVKLDCTRSCNKPLKRRAISDALKEKQDYLCQFSYGDINAHGASETFSCVNTRVYVRYENGAKNEQEYSIRSSKSYRTICILSLWEK